MTSKLWRKSVRPPKNLQQKDFAVDRQLVELKTLCGEVCTKLGTDVSQELWDVVSRQGRLSDPQRTVQGLSEPPEHLGTAKENSLPPSFLGVISRVVTIHWQETALFDDAKKTRFGPTVDRARVAGGTSIWL
eukprot:jgi/Undpi1/11217/HiC_scaffold_30.g13515.m1